MQAGQTAGKGKLWIIGICVFFAFITVLFLVWLSRPADTQQNTSAINTPQQAKNKDLRSALQPNSEIDIPLLEKNKETQQGPFREPPIMEGQQAIPLPSMFPDPTDWIRKLPEKTRNQVHGIFKQHAACVRKKSPAPSSASNSPDPEKLKAIFKECDYGLKDAMRATLTGDEYQQFLNSLHLKGPNLPAPPIPGKTP